MTLKMVLSLTAVNTHICHVMPQLTKRHQSTLFYAPCRGTTLFHCLLFQLDGEDELEEFDSIHQLCLSNDLPAPNATNRKWLSEKTALACCNVRVVLLWLCNGKLSTLLVKNVCGWLI